MITADEVKKAARNKGFPAGVVEKDYALTWLLYGVYNSDLLPDFSGIAVCSTSTIYPMTGMVPPQIFFLIGKDS